MHLNFDFYVEKWINCMWEVLFRKLRPLKNVIKNV